MSSPKEFHIDAVYPEPLSRLRRTPQAGGKADFSPASYRRAVKKQLHRGASSGRFRTQPVTFQEIQEVDEETVAEVVEAKKDAVVAGSAGTIYNKSETDLKAKFELFYRSISNDSSSNNNNNNSRSTPVPCSTKSPQIDPSISSKLRSPVTSSSSNSTDHHPPLAFNSKSRPSI